MTRPSVEKGLRLAGVLFNLMAGTVWACKYSVRDVGFVDLAEGSFGLYLFLDGTESEGLARDARTIATATFLESNLDLVVADLEGKPEHPSLWLAEEQGMTAFPAALIRSPDGQSLKIPLPSGEGQAMGEDELWTLMENAVSSPKREELLEILLEAYAVVVLLEGSDGEANEAARTAIEGAREAIEELMPRMPKPVETPPVLLTIGVEERASEAILLWSLGFDMALSDSPQAAILMGRGRRLGPPLEGGLITRTKLQQMLALIGQDCECELDRSWMQGPMVPLRWDSDQQQRAYKELAFDPENPLVKAEISRILARGPNARGETARKSDATMDTLFLGYSEELVEAVTSDAERDSRPDIDLPTELTSAGPNVAKGEAAIASVPETKDEVPAASPLAVAEVEADPASSSPSESTETPQQAIPLTLITILGLGLVALVGGAVVILRGPGV